MRSQIFKTKCNTTEKVFIFLLTLSLLFLAYKVFCEQITIQNVFIFLLLTGLFLVLTFLAYFDFKKMEVHNTTSLYLLISLAILNILLYLIFKDSTGIRVIGEWVYNPYNNMIGAIVLGSIFQLIVLISKEKALGQGDVRIALITGLLIGMSNLLEWGYITIFSALIYGLILAYKKKKFKGLKIPFVPFMVLGSMVVILLSL
mgnify:CR=1 FL=1